MLYLRSAVLLVGSACALWTFTSEAVEVVNASTNQVCYVSNYLGVCYVQPGQVVSWPSPVASDFSYGTPAGNAGSLTVADGHQYSVVMGQGTNPIVFDSSVEWTRSFMWGFGVVFTMGILAVGARWARKVIIGSANYSEL